MRRLLTLALLLTLAVGPALAVTYSQRLGLDLTRVGSSPSFPSTWTVTVYEMGAVATANSTGTTITVASGHGFTTGDKLMVGTNTDRYRTVSSTGATSVVVNSAVTVSAGDLIVNLGTDTGVASPNYDGSGVTIYQYPDGTGAYSSSRVTINSEGKFYYYLDNTLTVMELVRNSAGQVDEVRIVTPQGGGGGGGGGTFTAVCSTDRAFLLADGTASTDGTCNSGATLSSAGRMTVGSSAAPAVGDNATMILTWNDGSNQATEVTYPTGGQVNMQLFRMKPAARVANAASTIFVKGMDLDFTDPMSGDFDYLYPLSVSFQPNRPSGGTIKDVSSSVDMANVISTITLGDDRTGVFEQMAGFSSSINDDAGLSTSSWTAKNVAHYDVKASQVGGAYNSGVALRTNEYGIRVADMPAGGALITNWWGGYFGGPLLIVDNSSGGASVDARGWIAWGGGPQKWLQTAADVNGDGTTDSSAGVLARFRYNADSSRFELGIGAGTAAPTDRLYLSHSSVTFKQNHPTLDDIHRIAAQDTTLGEVYMDVDANATNPRIHTNVGVEVDPSTTLVNGLLNVQPNDNSQSLSCSAGTLCIADNDGSASDDWAVFNGTSPATVNVGSLVVEGTVDASETTITGADATADATITFPRNTTGRVPIDLYIQTAQVTVSTAASTTLVDTTSAVGTPTLPALFFDAIGKTFDVEAWGTYTTDASPGNLTVTLQVGSVNVAATSATALPASQTNNGWNLRAMCTAKTVGSGTSTTLWCQGSFNFKSAASGSTGYFDLATTAASSGFSNATTQLVDLEVNPSGAAGDTVTLTNLRISSRW